MYSKRILGLVLTNSPGIVLTCVLEYDILSGYLEKLDPSIPNGLKLCLHEWGELCLHFSHAISQSKYVALSLKSDQWSSARPHTLAA